MKKIAFIGHDLKFINHIIKFFQDNLNYETKIDQWDGHEIHDEAKSLEIIEWADILFCEWGLGNVIWYQKHKKENQKLIVRLHRFEMNTKYPSKFDYSKIDQIIAISPFIYEEFHRVAGIPREKMKVVFNAIDVNRFDKEKLKGSNFNIGMIGIVPKLKRLDRAIEIFGKLYEKDNRYHLYIKGMHPKEYGWVWNDREQREYYEKVFNKIENSHFVNNVHFEGWGDVAEWLQKIGYVLSVSDYESFHMAPIEGMASGSIPLVYQREGVNTIFPKEVIYKDFDDIVDFIIESNENSNYPSYKEFVSRNYSLETICSQIHELINNRICK